MWHLLQSSILAAAILLGFPVWILGAILIVFAAPNRPPGDLDPRGWGS